MSPTTHDIRWLTSLDAGLAEARARGRLLLLHPCGQGIGEHEDL